MNNSNDQIGQLSKIHVVEEGKEAKKDNEDKHYYSKSNKKMKYDSKNEKKYERSVFQLWKAMARTALDFNREWPLVHTIALIRYEDSHAADMTLLGRLLENEERRLEGSGRSSNSPPFYLFLS
ncbi:hypothetical protein Adt_28145 [Abeliophyllum distichum]|uniref:Uncharacterized protein n=1 Tax=Abeliophyllum distichum TaxID=126358 RepID=A0ABD1RXW3_9LAMI